MTDKSKRSQNLRFSIGSYVSKIWLILLTVCLIHNSIEAQIDNASHISGIINSYTKVLNVFSPGTDSVKVADVNIFHVNDAAMIVQMKYIGVAYPNDTGEQY